MQPDIKWLLLEVLKIIHYRNNKDRFLQDFEEMNFLDAMANLAEKLPEDLKKDAKTITRADIEKVKRYIAPEDYKQEVEKVTKMEFKKFIEVISPVLNLEQKQKIHTLVRNLDF